MDVVKTSSNDVLITMLQLLNMREGVTLDNLVTDFDRLEIQISTSS